MKSNTRFSAMPFIKVISGHGIILILLSGLSSCFENPKTPEVTTTVRTEHIAGNPLSIIWAGGKIQSDGGSEIFEKGICYGTEPNPTVSSGRTVAGFGNADYEVSIPLPPGNNYVRAYAANGAGIGYGESIPVTVTFSEVVIVDFGDVTAISAFMRARIESNQTILSQGACWSTNPNPTVNDTKTEISGGTGTFEVNLSGLTPGTSYYTRAFAKSGTEVYYSESIQFTTIGFAQLTTKELLNPGTFLITTGGNILTSIGVTEAGVCWSINSNPTIADNKTVDYVYENSFFSDPYDLLPGTTYYIRAYATNMAGTAYGNELSVTMPQAAVTDIDNNPYSSVTIGTQVWLIENLKTSKYANGEAIPNLTNLNDWASATSGAWSYYENEAQFNSRYGKLYNWFAVNDARNVCPDGWHVPNDAEWQTLITTVGGENIAGNKLKEVSTAHWKPINDFATNSTGFTALPGGARSTSMGTVYPMNSLGMFWTRTQVDANDAYGYYLFDAYQSINKLNYQKQLGLSVRCIKD
jgi:uncharacterized protein (TIGR02145 family)